MELFEPQLVAGDPPQLSHESGAHTSATELGMGLKVLDRTPVPDKPRGITVEDNPSGKSVAEPGGYEAAALRVETAEELVRDRSDVIVLDGREGESGGATRIRDHDPAVDQLSSELGSDLLDVGDLGEVGHAL